MAMAQYCRHFATALLTIFGLFAGLESALAAPSTPTGFTAPTSSSTGNFVISWNPASGTNYYELQSRLNAGAWSVAAQIQNATQYTESGRPAGDWGYRLRACDVNDSCSNWTAEKTVAVSGAGEPTLESNTVAGATSYSTGVTKGGNGYITVPIDVVPGVNGMQPSLSIAFNSGRKRQSTEQSLPADTLGYGFSLNGVPSMRRCVKNQPSSTALSLSSADRICLNGEPLVLMSGTYWQDGAVYRTLRESYQKVVQHNTGLGTWFEVIAPDGTVSKFGENVDSKVFAWEWVTVVHPGGSSGYWQPDDAYGWYVNSQTDTFGNSIAYSYHYNLEDGVNVPRQIVYGDNDDTVIDFEYVSRDDLSPIVIAGSQISQKMLLHTIRISTGGSLARNYRLISEQNPWRRLDKIQECAYDEFGGNPQCLEPLDFDWQEPEEPYAHLTTYVESMTDSLGATTTFEYGRIESSGAQPLLFSERPFGNEVAPSEATQLIVNYVVASVLRSNGIGGVHETSYAYHGRGHTSTKNWGYIGFYGVRITDETSGIVTYHQHRLDFPHFSDTAATRQFTGVFGQSGAHELARSEFRFAQRSHSLLEEDSVLPYVAETTNWLLDQSSTGGPSVTLGYEQQRVTMSAGSGIVNSIQTTTLVGTSQSASGGSSVWGDNPSRTLGGIQRTVTSTKTLKNTTSGAWLIGFVDDVESKWYRGSTSSQLDQVQTANPEPWPGTTRTGSVTAFTGDVDNQLTTTFSLNSDGTISSINRAGSFISSRTSSFSSYEYGRYPTLVTNPLGQPTTLAYDRRHGKPTMVTDPNYRTASVQYDGFGRELYRTTPDAETITTTYKRCGVDISCPSVNGISPVLQIERTSPISPTVTVYLDELGRSVRNQHRSFTNSIVREDVKYDALGRLEKRSRPYFAGQPAYSTTFQYDVRNRLWLQLEPDGSQTEIEYAGAGGVGVTITTTVRVLNADGSFKENQISERQINLLGELISVIDDVGGENVQTDYTYFGSGQLRSVGVDSGAANLATWFAYDDAGNQIRIDSPDLGVQVARYNALGQVRWQKDNAGNTISSQYDDLGRLTTRYDADGTAYFNFDPTNAIGQLASRSYKVGASDIFAETFSFNSNAKLTDIETILVGDGVSRTYNQGFTYDAHGRLEIHTLPSTLPVKRVYNGRGYVTSLRPTIGSASPYINYTATDPFGQVSAHTFDNGVSTQKEFDPITGLLLELDAGPSSSIQNEAFEWQSNGILQERHRVSGSTNYVEKFDYDGLNRLEESRNYGSGSTLTRTLSQSYDNRGNLLSKMSSAGADAGITNYGYTTARNRLNNVTIGGAYYALHYDANGGITQYDRSGAGDDKFITWNGRQLPTAFVLGDSVTDTTPTARDEFRYGPDGQRFYKKSTWNDNGTLRTEHTFYVTGGFEALIPDAALEPGVQEFQKSMIGDSVLEVRTVQTGGGSSSTFEYLHRDHLGSVHAITAASGNLKTTFALDPFGYRRLVNGNRTLNSGEIGVIANEARESTTRGYTGHENLDRTGFVHMGGRVYDPQIGRFVSPDPLVQAPGFSQSWNRYAYVMNSPVSANDPSGYESVWSGFGNEVGVGGSSSTVSVPVGRSTQIASPGTTSRISIGYQNTGIITGTVNLYPNSLNGSGWTHYHTYMHVPVANVDTTYGQNSGGSNTSTSSPIPTSKTYSHTEISETDQPITMSQRLENPEDLAVIRRAIFSSLGDVRDRTNSPRRPKPPVPQVGTVIKGEWGGDLELGETSSDVLAGREQRSGGWVTNPRPIKNATAVAISLRLWERKAGSYDMREHLEWLSDFLGGVPVIVYSPYDRKTVVFQHGRSPEEIELE